MNNYINKFASNNFISNLLTPLPILFMIAMKINLQKSTDIINHMAYVYVKALFKQQFIFLTLS